MPRTALRRELSKVFARRLTFIYVRQTQLFSLFRSTSLIDAVLAQGRIRKGLVSPEKDTAFRMLRRVQCRESENPSRDR
jgi:hypothetical protein